METLGHFSIPIEGMRDGIHDRMFSIDHSFFDHFENSPIERGIFEVNLVLDKRSDLIQLNFDIKGNFDTACDRCMAPIQFPLEFENQLLIKYADTESEDVDVIYISKDTHHINISKFLYDSICLSVPLTKVYPCRENKPFPCDEVIIEKLEGFSEEPEVEEIKPERSIWDSLKDINLGNN